MRRRSAAVLLGLLGTLACARDAEPAGYAEAIRAARDDGRSNRRYIAQLNRQHDGEFAAITRTCVRQSLETRDVNLALRLTSDGTVAESITHPQIEYADCLVQGIRELSLLPPPHEDFWVRFYVPPCEQSNLLTGCPQWVP